MKCLFSLSFLLLIQFTVSLHAQSNLPDDLAVYGNDPLLHNGKQYTYFQPVGTEGNPFLNDNRLVRGSVMLRGVHYDSLSMKYDIFNQQLVLLYKTINGQYTQISLSMAWMDSFELGASHFELMELQDTIKQIVQTIGKGKLRVAYKWRKEIALENKIGTSYFVFSVPKRTAYLQDKQGLRKYKNNKTFVRLFDNDIQPMVKKRLRQMHLSVKKADDQQMAELLSYCNTLNP
ncbi:MAG: hypothetical protein KGZ82_13780 [Bacteroidales bacterium]|nr:hypothetical protein [Bacteroidales bacterium]